MRYKAAEYAQALVEAVESAPNRTDEVIARFVALLTRTGDIAHARAIVHETGAYLRSRSGALHLVVESARPLTSAATEKITAVLGQGDTTEYVVRPELLGGVRISYDDGTLIDASLATKFTKLFTNS